MKNTMPAVRLRATISIEVDAVDYLEAAEHQRRLETHLSSVRSDYPEASISVTERRRPAATPSIRSRELKVRTGKLHAYE
jgi:hypothetical protein